MVEQRTLNPSVQSSSLCAPTRFHKKPVEGDFSGFLLFPTEQSVLHTALVTPLIENSALSY